MTKVYIVRTITGSFIPTAPLSGKEEPSTGKHTVAVCADKQAACRAALESVKGIVAAKEAIAAATRATMNAHLPRYKKQLGEFLETTATSTEFTLSFTYGRKEYPFGVLAISEEEIK